MTQPQTNTLPPPPSCIVIKYLPATSRGARWAAYWGTGTGYDTRQTVRIPSNKDLPPILNAIKVLELFLQTNAPDQTLDDYTLGSMSHSYIATKM